MTEQKDDKDFVAEKPAVPAFSKALDLPEGAELVITGVMPPEEQTVEKTVDDLNKAGVSSVTIKPVI